ncbi:MAG: radical SAM protein [Ruminococcaceae bacterium]|nr:radical SAM protein [Oscillospiraceae bacterium]
MLTKIYLETTNVCNLACSFCHGTKRKKAFMTESDFCRVLDKIQGKSKYLYLHLMGEPFLHPSLALFCTMARDAGFEVMLTSNGTLLSQKGDFVFCDKSVKKISISLQAAEISGENAQIDGENFEKYLADIAEFAKKCAENGVICVLRLWNIENGVDNNGEIVEKLHRLFPDEWIKNRSGYKLFDAPKGEMEVFLEYGEKFVWPDQQGEKKDVSFCYALRDQIGILCDGTVVPCCLDADGAIALGNIFESDLDDILASDRAQRLAASFEKREPCEDLCRSCGFAQRF